jgi:hypothetical protein
MNMMISRYFLINKESREKIKHFKLIHFYLQENQSLSYMLKGSWSRYKCRVN